MIYEILEPKQENRYMHQACAKASPRPQGCAWLGLAGWIAGPGCAWLGLAGAGWAWLCLAGPAQAADFLEFLKFLQEFREFKDFLKFLKFLKPL